MTTEEIGTAFLFTLKIMEIAEVVEGSQYGSEKKGFHIVFMLVLQTCIFHRQGMINSSNLLANCEILGFPPLYSVLDKLLDDYFCLASHKKTQRQDWIQIVIWG